MRSASLRHRSRTMALALIGSLVAISALAAPANATTSPASADASLDAAIRQFVVSPGGSPGIAVVVQRSTAPVLHAAGTAVLGAATPPQLDDQMRLASVSKAFSGAVAFSLVRDKALALNDSIGRWLPTLPQAWRPVTLSQLLNHTSGIPDFTASKAFADALAASLQTAPPPIQLLSYISREPLEFKPGTQYRYSNSDNIIVGLLAEAATGRPYDALLQERVFGPFGLANSALPRDASISAPLFHGYQLAPGQAPEDASQAFAAGWSWASGGINSTPADANRFIRGYARGIGTDARTRAPQFRFVAGESSPPGPGRNAAGLAVFRYQTTCGTVYGHTGNTAGYTQFVAATGDGSRSATVSVSAQINPKTAPAPFGKLRKIFSLAVCAALART